MKTNLPFRLATLLHGRTLSWQTGEVLVIDGSFIHQERLEWRHSRCDQAKIYAVFASMPLSMVKFVTFCGTDLMNVLTT